MRKRHFSKEECGRIIPDKKDEFYAKQSRCFVEDTFGGSLPTFLKAFIGGKRLSDRQADELKKLIDEQKEG